MDLTEQPTKEQAIAFKAILFKAATNPDGGWRLTLDVAQNDSDKILQLVQFRDEVLQMAAVPETHSIID